jgi:hypothetical protein
MEAVLTGRIRIALPDVLGTAEGQALIREIDLIEWLSKVSPKPFSQIGLSVLVAGDPHNSSNGMQPGKITAERAPSPVSQVVSGTPHGREPGVDQPDADRLDLLRTELRRGGLLLRRVAEIMWPEQIATPVLPWGPIWQWTVELVDGDEAQKKPPLLEDAEVWVAPQGPDRTNGFVLDRDLMRDQHILIPECAKSLLQVCGQTYRAELRLKPGGAQTDHTTLEGCPRRTGSREEIAGRHNAGTPRTARREGEAVRALSLPKTRSPAPTASLMTACEVLTWIAFGQALTRERIGGGELIGWWGTAQLGDLAVALEARAGAAPWCPLDGAFQKPHFMSHYVGREGPASLRALRSHFRRREGRLITFKEMRDLLEHDRCRVQQRLELLVVAERRLIEALQAQRLAGMGRGKAVDLQDIPALVLADRSAMVTVRWWDTLEVEIKGQIRYRFTDVQFRTSEVLVIWPVTPPHEDEAEEKVGGLARAHFRKRPDIWPEPGTSALSTAHSDQVAATAEKRTADLAAYCESSAGSVTSPSKPNRQSRLAIPNKPGAGGDKTAAAVETMVAAVREHRLTVETLRRMKQKELGKLYPNAKRTTLVKAREAALAQLIGYTSTPVQSSRRT